MVAEVADHVARCGLDEVFFNDDNFFTDLRRTEAICHGLLEAGVRVRWFGTGRADLLRRLDDAQLRLLKESGCYKINVGAESGSPELLKTIRKGTLVEEVLETAEKLDRAGIGARFSFIAGFPQEPHGEPGRHLPHREEAARHQRLLRDADLLLRALSGHGAGGPHAGPGLRRARVAAGLGRGGPRPLDRPLDLLARAQVGSAVQLLPAPRLRAPGRAAGAGASCTTPRAPA